MVKETLRVRPVIAGVGRVVRGEPFELNGYAIPPGVEINPSIATIHRRADRYPDPGGVPPRALPRRRTRPTPTRGCPFGGGTRRCLGASFALFEMQVVVRRVLERTELRAVGRPEKQHRRGVTLAPKHGVRVVSTVPARVAEPQAAAAPA